MYVYGVLRTEVEPLLPEAGIEGRPVGRVNEGALSALVSDAIDGPVRPSRRNVMAHSMVLQDVVAASLDVLPMQFGVVMPDARAVRDELLAAHGAVLHDQLAGIAGCVELTLTLTSPQETLLRSIIARDPRLADVSRRLRAASAESTYYERIELGEAIARAIAAEHDLLAGHVVENLAPVAEDAVLEDPRHEDMLVNAAFLVDRRRLADFDAAVESLGEDLPDEMRVRCLGPLPPYHFVDIALEQEAGTWA